MDSVQVVLEKIFMNNFLLTEEITSAFPKLLGNCSWLWDRAPGLECIVELLV
jgi:hypothetical protein